LNLLTDLQAAVMMMVMQPSINGDEHEK